VDRFLEAITVNIRAIL